MSVEVSSIGTILGLHLLLDLLIVVVMPLQSVDKASSLTVLEVLKLRIDHALIFCKSWEKFVL